MLMKLVNRWLWGMIREFLDSWAHLMSGTQCQRNGWMSKLYVQELRHVSHTTGSMLIAWLELSRLIGNKLARMVFAMISENALKLTHEIYITKTIQIDKSALKKESLSTKTHWCFWTSTVITTGQGVSKKLDSLIISGWDVSYQLRPIGTIQVGLIWKNGAIRSIQILQEVHFIMIIAH